METTLTIDTARQGDRISRWAGPTVPQSCDDPDTPHRHASPVLSCARRSRVTTASKVRKHKYEYETREIDQCSFEATGKNIGPSRADTDRTLGLRRIVAPGTDR
jgi:hypothetical protein